MMFLSAQALAETPALVTKAALAAPQVPNSQDQLIQVTLALAAVLLLIYAIGWFVKRNRGIQGMSNLPIKTLAVMPMGVKEKIVLIEVAGKQILLGMTAHNINTLATFDEPIVDANANPKKSFSDRLKEMMVQGACVNQESASSSNITKSPLMNQAASASKDSGDAS